jgi:hypothetical protein
MITADTSDNTLLDDMWGQYIIIDNIDEDNNSKIKYNKCENNKWENKWLKNVSTSALGRIEEEEWNDMGISERLDIYDDEYLLREGKEETVMGMMRNICNITWILCTTLIHRPYKLRVE